MILSIIIPYYKTLERLKALMSVLEPQLTPEVEVIIVDDGCDESELDNFRAKVIHLPENSGGASIPRNKGLDEASGKYIAFIDADDMVSPNYVEEILKKCAEFWDYFYIGWTCQWGDTLIEDYPPIWNTSVWNCVYKRSLIGDERFNPSLVIGEDKDFNLRVRKGYHSSIRKILYYYDTEVEGSLTWGMK